MTRQIFFASAILAASVSFSQAADELGAPINDIRFDWTGVYIGAHGGKADGDYRLIQSDGFGPTVDVDGFVGGGTIGYNWQQDGIVFGVEADISTGLDGTTPQGTSVPGGVVICGDGDCNTDVECFGTVRGRVGMANDRWLLYATGGFAWGEVEGGIFNSFQQGGGSAKG